MEDKGILEPNIWRDDGNVGAAIVGTLTVLGAIVGPGAPPITTLADSNAGAPGASLVVSGVGPALTVRKVEGGTALTAVQNADDVTVSLDNTAVVSGAYTQANITVDPQGRITAAANGSSTDVTLADSNAGAPGASLVVDGAGPSLTVRKVEGGTGLSAVQNADDVTVNIDATGVAPGFYSQANITVNAQGQITAAATGSSTDVTLADSNGAAPGASLVVDGLGPSLTVRKVEGGTALTAVQNADDVTLNLDNTAVAAGSYTHTNLTVDAQGRLTAAANGVYTVPYFIGNTGVNISNNGFVQQQGTSLTENLCQYPVPRAGTMVNLRIRLSAAPGGVTVRTLTMRLNGANTALAVALTGAATLGNSGATTVTVAADDLISLQCVNTGAPAASTVRACFEINLQ